MKCGVVPLQVVPSTGHIEGGEDFRFLASLGMTGDVGMTGGGVSWGRGRGGIFAVWRGVGVRGVGGGLGEVLGSGCWVLDPHPGPLPGRERGKEGHGQV